MFALACRSASAETFAVPADDPVATVSIPEKWELKSYHGGVEATWLDSTLVTTNRHEAW